jgi:RNA polymerase primary sigma factor
MDEESEEDLNIDFDATSYDEASDDSVKLYLREIGKIPLLSQEEEYELAQKIINGTPKEQKRAKDKWPNQICVWLFRLQNAILAAVWISWI